MRPIDFIAVEDHGRVKKAVKKVFAEGHCEFEASLSTVDRQNIPYILTG
jgi:hypothetical protein